MSGIQTLFDKKERARYRRPDSELVPRRLVQAMFALMLGALGIVAYAQWTEQPNVGVLVEAPIVQQREVILSGSRDGVYTVTDLNGVVIGSSADEKAGFIGVVGLVINRERNVRGQPTIAPLLIARRENGNIAVIDDSTGMRLDLIGYGADNVAAIAALLD